ncbi:NAD(P)-dependent oxidoreductase [Paludibacterium yongneupense]|uniref:NAD(P)-dependent oxidoreductase n=1 Tax=Paludibacterium yongneupense TaxID=400061 RepID=UPI000411D387|nr:NAD(P)-dependent oxidoreductase [Paludibacterium yongneupense]
MNDKTVAFLGLGSMGVPMARQLIEAGYAVTVFNRSPGRDAELLAAGAIRAASPQQAVTPGGIAVSMLSNDAALLDVALGEHGFLPRLGVGLHLSMSTVAPETSRQLAAAQAAHGGLFVAAPVFGRPDAAAAAKLWIAQSGAAAAKLRAAPLLAAMGQGVHDFGVEPGAANIIKLSGNFMILAAVEAMSEALLLAEKQGLDRETVADFFGKTVFPCPIYQNYGRLLARRQYRPAGFKLALGMKDIRLVRAVAEELQAPMPVADVLHGKLLSALARGRSEFDWTAIELDAAEQGGVDVRQ